MGNCLDCKWDRIFENGVRASSCFQGRTRVLDGVLLENCKDWEKKEKCRWCKAWGYFNQFFNSKSEWECNAKYLITLDKPMEECPVCGGKLEG